MQDATATLNEISGALDALANQAIAVVGEDRTFMEMWGWNMPAINRTQFADYLRSPINFIQKTSEKNVSNEDFALLTQYPGRITFFQSNSIQNLPGGNAFHVYLTARSLIDPLNAILAKYVVEDVDWKDIANRKLLPAAQIKRLHQIESSITRLVAGSDEIGAKISLINDAHAAAEALPADMQSLVEARQEYQTAMAVVDDNRGKALAATEAAEAQVNIIEGLKTQATQLVKNTEAAYSAATTQGLGKAFGDKAIALGRSTWYLGTGLAMTLALGAYISAARIDFIHKLMLSPNVSLQILWVNVTLTVISIAGPIWFAWVLTKQIGQRFRLSEDYAFKASVAKAYEGYRLEAVRLDPALEQRLFRSVLDRLDEAPLRHVEEENHGSPWHELFSRKKAKAVLTTPAKGSDE